MQFSCLFEEVETLETPVPQIQWNPVEDRPEMISRIRWNSIEIKQQIRIFLCFVLNWVSLWECVKIRRRRRRRRIGGRANGNWNLFGEAPLGLQQQIPPAVLHTFPSGQVINKSTNMAATSSSSSSSSSSSPLPPPLLPPPGKCDTCSDLINLVHLADCCDSVN